MQTINEPIGLSIMLRYRIKSLIFISLLFTLFVTPAAGEVINRVAAIVNDTIITTYQLDQKATEAAAQDPQYSNLDAAGQQTFKKGSRAHDRRGADNATGQGT